MGKTVYSLVLSEDVVAEIDALAIRRGVSRSALINRVLAEYASLSTPEQRTRDTLSVVEGQAAAWGLRTAFSPGGTLSLHTALRYKYNPSLSYLVQLGGEQGALGLLRVGFRSQNETLLAHVNSFFNLWNELEKKHLEHPPMGCFSPQTKRYIRTLRILPQATAEQSGHAIAAYVNLLNSCLKCFFEELDDPTAAQTCVRYQKALSSAGRLSQL